jgi:hypothetical protein
MEAHALAVTGPPGREEATPFGRDRALARWLDEQVEHELGATATARDRLGEAQHLTDALLGQVTGHQERLANRLTAVQTSVLGAVLGGLAVVQAVGPFETPRGVQQAALLTVPLLALCLPLLALRWATGVSWGDVVAGAACGAAAGWTVTAILSATVGIAPFLAGFLVAGGCVGGALPFFLRHQAGGTGSRGG